MNPDSNRVFYDFETERYAGVPEKWRLSGNIAAHLDEILGWAKQEGFDLMGTEYVPPQGGEPVFALRGIGLQTWQLRPDRWKKSRDVVTLEKLRKEGPLVVGYLLRRNPEKSSEIIDPRTTASFLAMTSERTPVLLHVGVEVQNDQLEPGSVYEGDPDMNPVGAFKGRRFAVMYLDEIEHDR
jgi:hypothetical protein